MKASARRPERDTRWASAQCVFALAFLLLVSACGGHGAPDSGARAPGSSAVRARAVPSTTTIRAPSIANIDFRSYTYEDRACGTHKQVRFTNGVWRQDPTSLVNFCGMTISAIALADVTGDQVPDAIVTGAGSIGGGTAVSSLTWTTVFAAAAHGPQNLGYFDGQAFPPYSTAGGITVWLRRVLPGEPACCPSSYQKTTYVYAKPGGFARSSTAVVLSSQLPSASSTSTVPTSSLPGSPLCTVVAIQRAITGGVVGPKVFCMGPWAVADVVDSADGDEYTALLKWQNGAWVLSPNADCNPSLPAPIYRLCATQ